MFTLLQKADIHPTSMSSSTNNQPTQTDCTNEHKTKSTEHADKIYFMHQEDTHTNAEMFNCLSQDSMYIHTSALAYSEDLQQGHLSTLDPRKGSLPGTDFQMTSGWHGTTSTSSSNSTFGHEHMYAVNNQLSAQDNTTNYLFD